MAAVEVPAGALAQVLARLSERRLAVELEVAQLGEPPTGVKDIFELCRGFERAFQHILNDSPTASKIKETFVGERGLAGAMQGLPLEQVFGLEHVKTVCRQADGYQPHLISPEPGLKLLATEALQLVYPAVRACVGRVHALLLGAARAAAAAAGQHTDAASKGGQVIHAPRFAATVMPVVSRALEDWGAEAEKVATMLVDMEGSYITAGFFRHTMYQRHSRVQSQVQAAQQGGRNGKRGGGGANGANGGGSIFSRPISVRQSTYEPDGGGGGGGEDQGGTVSTPLGPAGLFRRGATAPAPGSGSSTPTRAGAPGGGGLGAGAVNFSSLRDPGDFIAAHFDKQVSGDSARGALPQTYRWQRRFFILSDSQRMLYYFKSAEDVPRTNGLRGQVNLTVCVVEDVDEEGRVLPPPSAAGAAAAANRSASLLIRVRHADPRQACVKAHNALVLRAESVKQKVEWLARMQRNAAAASSGSSGAQPLTAGAPPPPSALQPVLQRDSSSSSRRGGLDAVSSSIDDSDAEECDVGLSTVFGAPRTDQTRLGEGSALFRAEDVRDETGRLMPAPGLVLSPFRSVAAKAGSGNATSGAPASLAGMQEASYDAFLEQIGSDLGAYVRMVCDTLSATVPKAVVHALVRRAEKGLLEVLFAALHALPPAEMTRLLEEGGEVVARRAAAKAALEDIRTAIWRVQQGQEDAQRGSDRSPSKVAVPPEALALSGMAAEHLRPEQARQLEAKYGGAAMPLALRQPPSGSIGAALNGGGLAGAYDAAGGGGMDTAQQLDQRVAALMRLQVSDDSGEQGGSGSPALHARQAAQFQHQGSAPAAEPAHGSPKAAEAGGAPRRGGYGAGGAAGLGKASADSSLMALAKSGSGSLLQDGSASNRQQPSAPVMQGPLAASAAPAQPAAPSGGGGGMLKGLFVPRRPPPPPPSLS